LGRDGRGAAPEDDELGAGGAVGDGEEEDRDGRGGEEEAGREREREEGASAPGGPLGRGHFPSGHCGAKCQSFSTPFRV